MSSASKSSSLVLNLKQRLFSIYIAATAILWTAAPVGAADNGQSTLGDQAWAALQLASLPTPLSQEVAGQKKTATQIKTEILQQKSTYRQIAAGAKAFYGQYPDHPKAVEARRVEAVSALRAVTVGDASGEQAALVLAHGFRQNAAYPVADRFAVALAMDRLEYSLRIRRGDTKGRVQDRIEVADNLAKEFGDIAELQAYYLQLAREADIATAARLAASVAKSANASSDVKATAAAIVSRFELIGKSLDLQVATVKGGQIDLGAVRRQVSFLVVWTPSKADSVDQLRKVTLQLPREADIIYLAIGDEAEGVSAMPANMSGTFSHLRNGPAARAAMNALRLKEDPLPVLYIINLPGAVVDICRPDDIAAALEKLRF